MIANTLVFNYHPQNDWSAKDLSDVSVALDLEKQQVMVTVSGWDGVVMMDIVI